MRRWLRSCPPVPGSARARLPVRGVAVGASGADRRLDRRAPPARRDQGAGIAAWIEALPPTATLCRFHRAGGALLPIKFLGLWMLAHEHWLGALAVLALAKVVSLGVTAFIFDLTRPKLSAAGLVPLALRARAGVARLGARPGRSDQARDQAVAAHVLAEARLAHAAAVCAHPPPHARRAWPVDSRPPQNRCTTCGAQIANRHEGDARARRDRRRKKISATMPVMTVADASTMPIWNAADATS